MEGGCARLGNASEVLAQRLRQDPGGWIGFASMPAVARPIASSRGDALSASADRLWESNRGRLSAEPLCFDLLRQLQATLRT